MTPLRQRMIVDMQLRGFSARTQEAYVHAVRQLANHFHKPPDRLTEQDLRAYFLYLTNVKHFARASFTIALCGIKFFFERRLRMKQSRLLPCPYFLAPFTLPAQLRSLVRTHQNSSMPH